MSFFKPRIVNSLICFFLFLSTQAYASIMPDFVDIKGPEGSLTDYDVKNTRALINLKKFNDSNVIVDFLYSTTGDLSGAPVVPERAGRGLHAFQATCAPDNGLLNCTAAIPNRIDAGVPVVFNVGDVVSYGWRITFRDFPTEQVRSAVISINIVQGVEIPVTRGLKCSAGQEAVLTGHEIKIGGDIQDCWPFPWGPFCRNDGALSTKTFTCRSVAALFDKTVPSFSGEWLSRKQSNLLPKENRTGFGSVGYNPNAYYNKIKAPATFAQWLKKYGFPLQVNGPPVSLPSNIEVGPINEPRPEIFNPYRQPVVVKYFNRLDLGIGRDMHCIRFGKSYLLGGDKVPKGVACYVTNYGDLPEKGVVTDDLERTTLASMHNLNTRGDTVAMTYDPTESKDTRVQFYIYGTALKIKGSSNTIYDSQARLKTSIKLDSNEPDSGKDIGKASPGLCLSCHGGDYDTKRNLVKNASFLPFDPNLFGYAAEGDIKQDIQESSFKTINSFVLATKPTPAIKDFIEGLYKGGDTSATASIYSSGSLHEANPDYIPRLWKDNPEKYKVAQKYCLMCHMALRKTQFNYFQSSIFFDNNLYAACSDPKTMPHAEVPYNGFWRSGAGWLLCNQ